MYRSFSYLVILFLLGCHPKIEKDDLKQLNGYWEIQEVEFPNGNTKDYAISTTIDYLEIDLEKMSGFRKKVQPQLNGSYQTSDDAEPFVILEKDGFLLMMYGEGTLQREEKIVALDKNSFSVCNSENLIYSYKRFEPFNLAP